MKRIYTKKIKHTLLSFYYTILYIFLSCFFKKTKITFIFSNSSEKFNNISYLYEQIKKTNNPNVVELKETDCHLKFIRILAESKVILIDQSNKFLSKLHLNSKTFCIQCWHSGGWYKKVGFDSMRPSVPVESEKKRLHRIHRNINYFIISDKNFIHNYARAFNISQNCVLPLGLPRTDLLFKIDSQQEKQKLKKIYPHIKNKKIILYAPTFRTYSSGLRYHDYTLNINLLLKTLGNDYAFFIRRHPSVQSPVPQGWIDISSLDFMFTLAVTDILITDYSSIIFDYAFFNRPILLLVPDKDSYSLNQNGLYLTPEEMSPKGYCYSTEDVISHIKNLEIINSHDLWNKFMSACDGKSSQRVLSLINHLYNKGE